MPGAFMQGLRDKDENAGKHIFHTNENQTFGQIAEREGIRPGAIVILDDSKGNPHHAMFWTGKRDENGEPQLIGFNGMGAEEESNVVLSYAKNGKARVGTIIDIGGMVADSMEKRNFRNFPPREQKAVRKILLLVWQRYAANWLR